MVVSSAEMRGKDPFHHSNSSHSLMKEPSMTAPVLGYHHPPLALTDPTRHTPI